MPNHPIPPGAGYSPTIHPQDFYEQPQGAPQPPPRNRGISTEQMIQNQFSSWHNLLRENDNQLDDRLAHLFSHNNALEQTGAARPDYMHEHLDDLHGQIMGKIRAFSSSVAPDMYRLGGNSQQPPARTHRPWQPQGSFHQAAPRQHETSGNSRPVPPVPRENVDHRQDGRFDYDALSPEEQLQANAYIHGASEKMRNNAKKNVHYPVSSQGWRRNHHVSEAENPDDNARVDADGALSDSDNQSFKDQPIASPTGRQVEHDADLRAVPAFDELYDVTDDESSGGHGRKAQLPPRTQGPALPARNPSADLPEDTSDAPENRPQKPPRPAASTTMPMSRAMQPTSSLSAFPPPPSAPPLRGRKQPPDAGFSPAAQRPQGPAGENGPQLSPRQSGGITRKAAPALQASTRSPASTTIPPHINDWLNNADVDQLEVVFLGLAAKLGKMV